MAANEDRFSSLLRFYNQTKAATSQVETQNDEQQFDEEDAAINDEVDRSSNALVDQGMGMYEAILLEQSQQQHLQVQQGANLPPTPSINTCPTPPSIGTISTTSSPANDGFVVMKYDAEMFINEIESYPCLWNTSTRSHHDQNMRKLAWEELSKKFGKTVDFLKKEWKNLRENLRRCLQKRNDMSRSGAAGHTLPKCKYFSQLQFVHDKVLNKDTQSNVSLPSPLNVNITDSPVGGSTDSVDFVSPASSTSSVQSQAVSRKRKSSEHEQRKSKDAQLDVQFLKVLQDINDTSKLLGNVEAEKQIVEEDDNSLFCRSLIPTLRSFGPRKNKLAKLKIQQVLFELEFDE